MNFDAQRINSTIGNTPIIYLRKFSELYNASFFLKLESRNPGGSIKDRIALQMVQTAIQEGKVSENGIIVEPTSGNTGIGLAIVAKEFGLTTMLVMPESMSIERRKLLQAYGAELVLTPADQGMSGAVKKAKELVEELENAYMPDQFSNPACVEAHYQNTGPEILDFFVENSLELNAFVAGVGSSGTLSGVGKYLKENISDTHIIAVEPATSAVLSGEPVGKHGIQGIGAGFIPDNFNRDVVDNIYKVTTEKAIEEAQNLMKLEGISCGISTGANLAACIRYAINNPHKNIVTVAPDAVDKYLSTALFNE